MIEKILSKFREIGNIQFSQFSKPLIAVEDAIKIVQEVAKEYGNGWIPTEKELPPMPEENPLFENKPLELYLVTLKGQIYPFRAFWNGKFFTDGWGKVKAIAWMPLPPVYQKGE